MLHIVAVHFVCGLPERVTDRGKGIPASVTHHLLLVEQTFSAASKSRGGCPEPRGNQESSLGISRHAVGA